MLYINSRRSIAHGKNDFAEISKNLARYRFENNFIGLSKLFCRIK